MEYDGIGFFILILKDRFKKGKSNTVLYLFNLRICNIIYMLTGIVQRYAVLHSLITCTCYIILILISRRFMVVDRLSIQ
jgi:hypothetical protein